MTNLKCLATGSSGNCYILTIDENTILLDAGCTWNKITQNINLNKIDMAYISHIHKDHSANLEKLVLRGVYCVDGINTQEIIKKRFKDKFIWFKVPIQHGECVNNALIVQKNEEIVLYATDFNLCEYDLSEFKFTRVIVECNYLEEEVKNYIDDTKVRRQINTHMGLEGLKIFLDSLDLSKCTEIDLVHMSSDYGSKIIMGSSIYSRYKIKTGVCLKNGGIEYYG